VDLDLLEERRVNGTVLPLNDLIRDAYDRVIHCTDQPVGDSPEPRIAGPDTPKQASASSKQAP
jgi:hypothetical protein